ncbi:DUF92 domain-containing protein [Cuniculiplasma sp. SKW3]|uniref:DUF92 domain-containing protein n=1 Tax=unclassified Cuniculiplasma TaxID=2619706 RepID=UPI003FD63EC9
MLYVFSYTYIFTVAIVLLLLFILSQLLHMFDFKGALAAIGMGAIVSFLGYITWLLLLIVFAISSHLVTKYRFDYKKSHKYQEGERGERKISNVIYAGSIGIVIAIANFVSPFKFPYFLLFAAAFAAITADTFGSEIGTLDSKTYMITTLKRTTTGINGGISLLGELAALTGSLIIAICYSLMSVNRIIVYDLISITIAGFLSCQIDSILGAVFENKGKLSKGQVNFIASLSSVLIALPFFLVI